MGESVADESFEGESVVNNSIVMESGDSSVESVVNSSIVLELIVDGSLAGRSVAGDSSVGISVVSAVKL